FDDLKVVLMSEKLWAGFHDVFACVRDDAWPVQHSRASTAFLLKARCESLLSSFRDRVRLRSRMRTAYGALQGLPGDRERHLESQDTASSDSLFHNADSDVERG